MNVTMSLLPLLFILLVTMTADLLAYTYEYLNENSEYFFTNPGYPTPIRAKLVNIELQIKLIKPAHQLRIDFIEFNIAPPDPLFKTCDEDVMIVVNKNYYLGLCGSFNDRHLYFDVNDENENVVVYFRLGRAKKLSFSKWMIKITQLMGSALVPRGCLQYYDGLVGTVPMIDYSIIGTEVTNLNQRVCIKEFEGICNIFYQPCAGNLSRGHGHISGKLIKSPILTVVPFKQNTKQVVLNDDFQSLCITYQQDPCQYSNAFRLDNFKPYDL
ncbi:Hypothetical protein CINCED_3A010904 [Cinara cedri]|uniref:CUB domain-containing protein n=1 Tax=Cinara cedri TaxID=506608 RepID=A0A5E4M4D9_9HEMI|nr:Hypothetical protein CINCED_3A010904 [Cinara cedri]